MQGRREKGEEGRRKKGEGRKKKGEGRRENINFLFRIKIMVLGEPQSGKTAVVKKLTHNPNWAASAAPPAFSDNVSSSLHTYTCTTGVSFFSKLPPC
jgi:hypothetical protein